MQEGESSGFTSGRARADDGKRFVKYLQVQAARNVSLECVWGGQSPSRGSAEGEGIGVHLRSGSGGFFFWWFSLVPTWKFHVQRGTWNFHVKRKPPSSTWRCLVVLTGPNMEIPWCRFLNMEILLRPLTWESMLSVFHGIFHVNRPAWKFHVTRYHGIPC